MKKKLIYSLLGACCCWGTPALAQVAEQHEQIHIGQQLPGDSVRLYLEYPEYVKLSSREVRELKREGFVPAPHVQFKVAYSVSRGQVIADVSFVPVVRKNGTWLKLTKYDLKSQLLPAPVSGLSRQSRLEALSRTRAARYASHSVLAQGKWVKIRVSQEGLYQLSDRQLAKMGFQDPSRVRLYGYGGRMLPEHLTFTGPDALIDDLNEVPLYRRSGSSVFFAEGLTRWNSKTSFSTNTYSRYSYYFLTEGDQAAPWQVQPSSAQSGTEVREVPAYALFDNDAFVWYGGGRDFYDVRDTQGVPVYELSLPGNTGAEQLVVYNMAIKATRGTTQASITQNSSGSQAVSLTIRHDGELARGYRGTFRTQMGEKEKFIVKTSNTGRLDYLYTVYTQKLSAAHTRHAFTVGRKGQIDLVVADADANTRVWQLGNAQQTVSELTGSMQGNSYVVPGADGMGRYVLVDITRQYPEPEVVGAVANQDLHADADLDYVMIVPPSGKLTAQAERLADFHRQRGLHVKVVNAEMIYNEFSSGTPDATAYRRYLKMLYDRASGGQRAPQYLLLFGDCSYDNRMLTAEWKQKKPEDYLLAYERCDYETVMDRSYTIGSMNNYVTDDYYALLDDGEGRNVLFDKIDMGVGRFICHTPEEAKWLVDHTISYMNNEHVGVWKNRMWAVGDVGDDNLHMNDALEVSRMVRQYADPSFLLRYNFPDIYTITAETKGGTYPEATHHLKRAMKQGALIFNYNGHGSPDRLSHQFLLDMEDWTRNSSSTLPLWIFASCEITPYDQHIENIGRNALYSPTGPSVAVLCAARSVYANYNRMLNMGFMKYVFAKNPAGQRYTLGDALRLTKVELTDNDERAMINKVKYVLLGDPALALSYPDPGIRIDSINGKQPADGKLVELPIGDVVRFSGYIHETDQPEKVDTLFNGTLTGSVFTPKQQLTCKGYGNKYADPLQYEDYTRLLFEGSVEVKKGRFTLEFMVPRGVTLSTEQALLSLYAVEQETHREYSGRYDNICINGFSAAEQTDSIGPSLYMYLNTPDFPNGAVVSPDPVFYVSVSDSSALSMVSGNLGHDMELWMDDDLSTLQTVNDYFTFDYGSYQKGSVIYPLYGLQPGRHTLNFRAWDVFDNSSKSSLDFVVSEAPSSGFDVTATVYPPGHQVRLITTLEAPAEADGEVVVEIYSIAGYRVWHTTGAVTKGNRYVATDWDRTDYAGNRLNRGVYLYRSKYGKKHTDTKKIVLL